MNYSRQREIIKEVLAKNPVHPTAEKLLEIIKEKYPQSKIGIATVYRNLKKLAEKGEIKQISGFKDAEHFDHNTSEHYHFFCKECSKIYDIKAEVAEGIINKTQNQTGFIVEGYDIAFTGICKNCQKR